MLYMNALIVLFVTFKTRASAERRRPFRSSTFLESVALKNAARRKMDALGMLAFVGC